MNNGGITDLTATIIIILVLLVFWVLLKQMGRKRKRRSFRSISPGDLRERYLRGEISPEEYEAQKKRFERK
jgi:uncharacterized membrane protein